MLPSLKENLISLKMGWESESIPPSDSISKSAIFLNGLNKLKILKLSSSLDTFDALPESFIKVISKSTIPLRDFYLNGYMASSYKVFKEFFNKLKNIQTIKTLELGMIGFNKTPEDESAAEEGCTEETSVEDYAKGIINLPNIEIITRGENITIESIE